MEYCRDIEHICLIRRFFLDQRCQSDHFIHRHTKLLCTLIELVVQLGVHVTKESRDDLLFAGIHIEIISIREQISA